MSVIFWFAELFLLHKVYSLAGIELMFWAGLLLGILITVFKGDRK